MWHKSKKFMVFSKIVLIPPLLGISTLCLYGCGLNSDSQVTKSKARLPLMPKHVVKKINLNELKLEKFYIGERTAEENKIQIRDYVHKFLNWKNTSVNGNIVNLTEGVNYVIKGIDESPQKIVDDRTRAGKHFENELQIKARASDPWLSGELSFRVGFARNNHYSLHFFKFNEIFVSSQDPQILKKQISDEITRQTRSSFMLTYITEYNVAWTIDDFDKIIEKLVAGYTNGISVDVCVKANFKERTVLDNSQWVRIWNFAPKTLYATDLGMHYTHCQFINAIGQTRAKLNEKSEFYLLADIRKNIELLWIINKRATDAYKQISWALKTDSSVKQMNESDVKEIYDVLSQNINQNFFYWTYSDWVNFVSPLEDDAKKEWNTIATKMLQAFAGIRPLYPVSQLMILLRHYLGRIEENKSIEFMDRNKRIHEILSDAIIGVKLWCENPFVKSQLDPNTKFKILTFHIMNDDYAWFSEQLVREGKDCLSYKDVGFRTPEISEANLTLFRKFFPIPFPLIETRVYVSNLVVGGKRKSCYSA